MITLNLSSPSNTYAVNPIIALEGINLGVNILKGVGDKVKDAVGSKKKKKKTTKEYQWVCINDGDSKSENLIIGKFYLKNHNYDLCINKTIKKKLYNDLFVHLGGNKVSRTVVNNILYKHDHYYRFNKTEKIIVKKNKSKNNQNLKETDMVVEWIDMSNNSNIKGMKIHHISSGINYWKEFNNLDLNENVKIAKELCEYSEKRRLNRSYAKCDLKTVVALSSTGEKSYFNISNQTDLNLLAQKISNNFGISNKIIENKYTKLSKYKFCDKSGTIQMTECWSDGINSFPEFLETYLTKRNKSESDVGRSDQEIFDRELIRLTKEFEIYNLDPNEIIMEINNNQKLKKFLVNSKTMFASKDQNKNIKSFSWHALVKHPKTSKEFIATNVSNEKEAKRIALSKCYDFVTNELSKRGYNDCYVGLTVDENVNQNLAKDLIDRQNNKVVLAKSQINDLNSLGDLVDFNLTFKETIKINGKQYQISVVTDNLGGDGSERKYFDIIYLKNQTPTERYFINYYDNGSKEYVELQNINETKRFWLHGIPSKTSNNWYEERSIFVDNELQIGKFVNKSDGKELFGIYNSENKTASEIGSWEVWGLSINNLNSDIKLTNKVKKQKFNFAKFHYERSQETLSMLIEIEAELKKQVLEGKLNKFAKGNSTTQNKKVAKKEPKKEEFKPDLETIDSNKAPKLIVQKSYTFKNSSYEIKGQFEDEHDSVFIEVDGRIIQAKDGKFSIQRFSPVDEEIKLVAIDKWGKKSEPQIVKIKIDMEETIVAENIEPLNPNNIRGRSNNNKVALIIGIENYSETPQASYANLDAKYFYEYSKKAFGVKPSNINLLIDEEATFVKTSKALTKWLNSKVKKNRSELIIFFAGHGLASTDGKELYLLPQDSDPDLLSRTALSRTELFKEIMAISPKSVTMFLDTCFSGISRDEKTLLASARPIRIVADENEDVPGNFTIFSASQLDQISSGLKEAEHGIFSYYLMKGLEGKADQNNDRKITNGELLAYMDENISQKASELGREQNPSLTGDPNQVLSRY